MDKILLIDSLNFLYRAAFSFGKKITHSLINEDYGDKYTEWGTPPSGNEICSCGGKWIDGKCEKDINEDYVLIFNFFRNLRPIVELFSPDKIFFVCEGHPQFRYDLYPEYKANRIIKEASKKEAKDKIHRCMDEVIRLMQYLPITICQAINYEADDTIATLVENMKEEDLVVVSNDSDFIQLLQKGYKNCRVYNSMKKVYQEAPEYPYVIWKSLAGDKSDNISSLLKPKKVIEALNNPDILKSFIEIEENRANFNINKQLIEFRMVPEEELILTEGVRNFDALKQEFAKMQFESITNDISWAKYIKTFDCVKY